MAQCNHLQTDHAGGNGPAGAVTDPVCGMVVDPAKTPHPATHQGRDFSFCSARCQDRFVADP